jgi:hypothetical protein
MKLLIAFLFGLNSAAFAGSEKILRCEITETSASPPPGLLPQTFAWTMTYKIVGNQWTAISRDGASPNLHLREVNAEYGTLLNVPMGDKPFIPASTAKAYVIVDDAQPAGDTSFLSIDRATGAVSGSWHEVIGDVVLDHQKTGHCTPFSAL